MLIYQIEKLPADYLHCFKSGRGSIFNRISVSFADTWQLYAEFVSRLIFERASLAFFRLDTKYWSISAIGNDYSCEHVFVPELQGLAKLSDVCYHYLWRQPQFPSYSLAGGEITHNNCSLYRWVTEKLAVMYQSYSFYLLKQL